MTRPPLAAPIVSLLVASLLVQPTIGWSQDSAQGAAERALIRKMELQRRGQEETRNGETEYKKRDYAQAFAHFNNACNLISPSAQTEDSREDAVDGLTKAGRKLAEQRVTEGYYADAVQILKVVLRHNPNDKGTLKLLANIEAPDYFNKAITPQHRANVEDVKANFIKAENYKKAGRYDLAILKVEEILNKDRYNIAASQLRGEIYDLKARAGEEAYNATRAIALQEVQEQWKRPIRPLSSRITVVQEGTRSTAPSTAAIMRKLTEIKIPRVDFREATVREAMEFLQQRARALDPEGVGVNIVLRLDEGVGGALPSIAPPPAAAPAPIPGLDLPPGAAAPGGIPIFSGGAGTKITLQLNNVPLIEVIRYITNLASLKYKVDPYAVYIVPVSLDTTEMYIKEWKVPASVFRQIPAGGGSGLSPTAPPPDPTMGTGGSALAGSTTARDFLAANGVTFGPNSFAMFTPSSSTLIVKNTQEQLDLVERVIETFQNDTAIKQIEIQAKFVEITQNNLKELSFDWLLGQANVPGISTQSIFFGGGTAGNTPFVNPADYTFVQGATPIGASPISAGTRSGSLAINANAIDALLFGSGVMGSSLKAPGIFALTGAGTDPSFQVMVRALDQKKGIDLLSAPRVTTKSGNRAVIEIIREFRYATEFEQPQIPQTFGGGFGGGGIIGGGIGGGLLGGGQAGTFPVTPTTPTAFETRNTGVTLEVEPNIGPDGTSIEMQLAPQVVEFEGFINYGSPIQTTSTNPITGQQTVNVITPNVINQPIFSTRKVTTNVTVYDGATVVLGGLVREDVQKVEDKVPLIGDLPVVGRLFRSNVDQHIKRNLVIFVTARIVDAEGQPIRSEEEKEERVDELGLPDVPPPPLDLSGFRK